MKSYQFHPEALKEADDAASFYQKQQPGLETRFLETLEDAITPRNVRKEVMTNKLDNIMVILDHYHLKYKMVEFIDFDKIQPVSVMDWFKEELAFSLKNRGEDDKEAFSAEFIVVPFLKEVWKKHSLLNLY